MLTTAPVIPLKIWVACLNCYNSGDLVGAWIDAVDASELTIAKLHEFSGSRQDIYCEEMYCFDLDGPWPISHEMDLLEAQEWADAYAEVEPHLWPALGAWVASGCYIAASNGDVPVVPSFLEACQGEYDSFHDYAEWYAGEIGLWDHWPEAATRYFDWDKYTRDLEFEFTTMRTLAGGIYVFSNP